VRCPLCLDVRAPRRVLSAHGHDLVRCRACGLVRVAPFPAAHEALAQYDQAYFAQPQRGYVDYVADEAVFRAEFRRRLRTLRPVLRAGALLDVGCASGALLDEARARGFVPSGLEPSPAMAARAADRSGCPVRATSLDRALLESARYDGITLFDVLEHLTDPLRALRTLRRALVPGGVLAVTVPDFGGAWARVSGARWPFVTPWEHLLYFTRRTLGRALREAGFEHVVFRPARTPVSFGTLAAKGVAPARWLPRRWRHRGFGLPAGTLFATARAPRPAPPADDGGDDADDAGVSPPPARCEA
jgi:SAM-dependent methyltransferase